MNSFQTGKIQELSAGTILYFENDVDLAEITIALLETSNYTVYWLKEFPSGGIEALKKQLPELPDAVIVDIGMPVKDGYQICIELRENCIPDDVPVMFTSGGRSTEDIIHAYEIGASDYLQKPIRNEELLIKIDKALSNRDSVKNLNELLDSTRSMAFDAMTVSSELGNILHFLEDSFNVKDHKELATLLLEVVSDFGIKSSVMFTLNDDEHYYSFDGKEYPMEIQVFKAAKTSKRIIDIGVKTLFNYETVSLLVKNMPKNDTEKYGHLKGQLCLLLNTVNERIKFMKVEISNNLQKERISILARVIGKMVVDMEENSVNLSEHFERIILDLESNMRSDMVGFNLLQEEEESLMGHVSATVDQATMIFDRSLELETEYAGVMKKLLENLNENLKH